MLTLALFTGRWFFFSGMECFRGAFLYSLSSAMVTSLLSGILASMSKTIRWRVASEYMNSPEISVLWEGKHLTTCMCVRQYLFMDRCVHIYYAQLVIHLNTQWRFEVAVKTALTDNKTAIWFVNVFLPAFPGMPLRIPARLGSARRRLLLCSFSMDRYLFFMCAGMTRLSKSLFWILGTSLSPSFCSIASFMSSWLKPSTMKTRSAKQRAQDARRNAITFPELLNRGPPCSIRFWQCALASHFASAYMLATPWSFTHSRGGGNQHQSVWGTWKPRLMSTLGQIQ